MIPIISVLNLMYFKVFFVEHTRLLLAFDPQILKTARFPKASSNFKGSFFGLKSS